MVVDFVGDYIGLGEVVGGGEVLFYFVEEF